MEKPFKKCNNLGILPPTFGSKYSSKPKLSNKSKMVSNKQGKLNKCKINIIQHKRRIFKRKLREMEQEIKMTRDISQKYITQKM